jgi:putative endonuclease
MTNKQYYVYILANKRNGTLYIGVTNDLVRRLHEHKHHKLNGFTDKYDVTRLVWYDITGDIYAAIQKEKSLKHYPRQWKINLINKHNPSWSDLSENWT